VKTANSVNNAGLRVLRSTGRPVIVMLVSATHPRPAIWHNLTGVLPMEITRLSTKGQIVLPKNIRASRAWAPGTEFTVEETGGGILLRPARHFPETELDQVAGCLPCSGKPKTLAQMHAAIGREVKRRHDCGRY
jgi:AbrB family looped-hinge helix DNA binding protein